MAQDAGSAASAGFDGATGGYGDLIAQGILQPGQGHQVRVQNAASIAGMLLTTETLVVDKPEEEGPALTATGTLTRTKARSSRIWETRVPARLMVLKPGLAGIIGLCLLLCRLVDYCHI